MKKPIDKNMMILYIYFGILFGSYGVSSYLAKYYGEIGLLDSQIGMLGSVPAIIGMFFQPVWGTISDRIKLKKYLLAFSCCLQGIIYFLCGTTTSFVTLLVLMIIMTIISQPISPVSNTIAMEYVEGTKHSFGPIRMSGSIGYQIGALVFGFVMVGTLDGTFEIMGIILIICAVLSFTLPPIEGHQHGKKEKKSYLVLLKDKQQLILLFIIFIGATTHSYYGSFFTKHLGDLGIGNDVTGILTVGSLFLEIPFLFFSQKLYKKASMWTWLLWGFMLNGVRYVILGLFSNIALIFAANLVCVISTACFEFFPVLYMNEHTSDELKGSAQSLINLVSFGISKVFGGLLGGFLSDAVGIGTVFVLCGSLMLVAFVIFFPTCRKMAKRVPVK